MRPKGKERERIQKANPSRPLHYCPFPGPISVRAASSTCQKKQKKNEEPEGNNAQETEEPSPRRSHRNHPLGTVTSTSLLPTRPPRPKKKRSRPRWDNHTICSRAENSPISYPSCCFGWENGRRRVGWWYSGLWYYRLTYSFLGRNKKSLWLFSGVRRFDVFKAERLLREFEMIYQFSSVIFGVFLSGDHVGMCLCVCVS